MQLKLGDTAVDVMLKDIKNVHLSVYPPTGRVRISAPSRMSMESIRVFAIAKLAWIRRQQKKVQEQDREPPREFLDRESHFVWGRRYLLKVVAHEHAPSVELAHRAVVLRTRPGLDRKRRQSILDEWYRSLLRESAQPLINKWARTMGVKVDRWYVQRMKTKWGSCNPKAQSIRLNSELAKKPPECLEYIVVHELIHLLEPTHSERFVALMDNFMPHWHVHRDELNRMPLRHEDWSY